jgi:hypothetical protein
MSHFVSEKFKKKYEAAIAGNCQHMMAPIGAIFF